jgi:excisionase family DNA binding protein
MSGGKSLLITIKKNGTCFACTNRQKAQGRATRTARRLCMKLISTKRFFRPDEAAAILVLSRRTVYRMMRDGRINATKYGGGPWRIPRESLANLLPGERF